MNINKGDVVYAVTNLGEEDYICRKERFIKWYNGYPVCTFGFTYGAEMGYLEIWPTKKEAKSRCNRLAYNDKKIRLKREHDESIKILAAQYNVPETDIKFILSQLGQRVKYTEKDFAFLMLDKMRQNKITGYELYLEYKDKYDISREEILYMLDGTCVYNMAMLHVAEDFLDIDFNELVAIVHEK